jgi:site-specific DNA-methyltransferase (adenine-specific)
MQTNKIYQGDCLEILKTLAPNSIDAIVTDPPYGISFMGKKWDYDVPQVELWQEVLRVLKPGGHALVACGTRTQHRMAVNLEDAGFEIRDIVAWVYGSGFPKSLNICKAIDKLQGNEREIIKEGKQAGKDSSFRAMNPSKKGFNSAGFKRGFKDKGNSPYEGWGTALKPAMELWTLCRKPIEEKTIAENVLKYGTGGINIDGCRVGTEEISVHNAPKGTFAGGEQDRGSDTESYREHTGRFPANLIHDGSDEVVSMFPETKGQYGGKGRAANSKAGKYGWNNLDKEVNNKGATQGIADSGSASRFFYCAKASKAERNKGLEGFEKKQKVFNGQSDTPSKELKDIEKRFTTQPAANNHPTVKPISLMRYLCKLITPKGGIVLDPFMGSGSTGIGAKLEGFDFIGIEREEEYCKIAEARIKAFDSP